MAEDDPDTVLADAPERLENADNCWDLLLAERGGDRLNNLSELLSLTSIIEREYTHIRATTVRTGTFK